MVKTNDLQLLSERNGTENVSEQEWNEIMSE
jgi:hypothetical protein